MVSSIHFMDLYKYSKIKKELVFFSAMWHLLTLYKTIEYFYKGELAGRIEAYGGYAILELIALVISCIVIDITIFKDYRKMKKSSLSKKT